MITRRQFLQISVATTAGVYTNKIYANNRQEILKKATIKGELPAQLSMCLPSITNRTYEKTYIPIIINSY